MDGESDFLMPTPTRARPKPDKRTPFQKHFTIYLIMITVVLERMAFYGLAANLSTLLSSNSTGWEFPNTIIASLIFLGKKFLVFVQVLFV